MAAQAQRIADLERQMAELRAEFEAVAGALDYAFAAGRASITDPRPATPPHGRRPSHVQLVSGGAR